MKAFAARRAAGKLNERGGKPQRVRPGPALRALGKRHDIHPRDTYAALYSSRDMLAEWAELNAELYGHPVLGEVDTERGVIGVYDLRPQHARAGVKLTPPEMPDDWRP